MFRAIFLFLFAFASVLLHGQQYRFSHFTIKDGLSQNTVNCILQDLEGYYWFGTQDGLNRFDGYTVKVYRNDRADTGSISDNFIMSLAEDGKGNLWIGTRNGINFFDKKTERFTRVWMCDDEKKDYHNTFRYVFSDDAGNIFSGNRYATYLKKDQSSGFLKKSNDEVILPKLGEQYGVFNAKKNELVIYSSGSKPLLTCRDSVCKKAQAAWSLGESVLLLTDEGMKLHNCRSGSTEIIMPQLLGATVNCIVADSRKNLWVGTTTGLFLYKITPDLKSDAILFKHISEDPYSLNSDGIQGIYEDKQGLVWVGTSEGGVNIYDPAKEIFTFYDRHTKPALSSNSVWGICQFNKDLWVGTVNGLNRMRCTNADPDKYEQAEVFYAGNPANSVCSNYITSIEKDKKGNLWFGSHDKGISIYDPVTKKWQQLNKDNGPFLSNCIFHLQCDSKGDMWISTLAGLYCYHPQEKRTEPYYLSDEKKHGLASGYIISTFEDRKKDIWVATPAGMYKYEPATNSFKVYKSIQGDERSLSYNIVTSFFEDSKGCFWVATLGGGFNRMDRNTGSFTAYYKKQGLANDVCYCITEDKKGRLWISTNGGLSCFDPDKIIFRNYTLREGLISNEYAQNAICRTNSGLLLFGSPEGMMAFDPNKLNPEVSDIPILLTDLKINYRSVLKDSALDLFYGDKTVSFEFSAIDARLQEKLAYAFKLEGFDSDWHDAAASERIASYTNLPFGTYRFKVRVKAGNGDWQERTFQLPIRVIPPFWLSTWFILLEAVVGLVLIVFIVNYYSQRKLKRKLREAELQEKIHLERERISRDLHDNVGSHLTYIITSLDNIAYKAPKQEVRETSGKIESLGDFARTTMQQLRETIWAMNKDSVTAGEMKEKIVEHLSKVLSSNEELKFKVAFSGNENVRIKPSQAIHLFRIVQEAVNNALKHSGARNLEILIEEKGSEELALFVVDDGKGFEGNDPVDGHYGLGNMKARAEEMGGKFILSSTRGKGTRIQLIVPI